MTTLTMSNNPYVVLLDQMLEEKLEGRKIVRAIDRRLYKLLPDHRIYFRITRLPHDAIDGVKQRCVS